VFRSGVLPAAGDAADVTITAPPSAWTTILLDIEGTTTPITFVHEVLFPYARQRLASFLDARSGDPSVAEIIARLRGERAADSAEASAPPWAEGDHPGLVAYLEFLMDQDRKSSGLKAVQGLIWEEGYRRGDLHGIVFPDVAPAMRRWHAAGKRIAIYSSGSVLAQRLLFSTTPDGDLTTIIDGFFDTGVGAKVDANSYRRISEALGVPPARVLFVSDVDAELAAAAKAGCQVLLSERPGNPPQSGVYKGAGVFSTV
jgi:enolase-phosphatase E1